MNKDDEFYTNHLEGVTDIEKYSVYNAPMENILDYIKYCRTITIVSASILYLAVIIPCLKANIKPFRLLSISETVRMGLDQTTPKYERYQDYSFAIIIMTIITFIISDTSILYVYTTDALNFVFGPNSSLRIAFIVTYYLLTLSFISTIAITYRYEGVAIHNFFAVLFFAISSTQRLVFLRSNVINTISTLVRPRRYATGISMAMMIAGVYFQRTKYWIGESSEFQNIIDSNLGEALIGGGELIAIALVLWDRFDLMKKIRIYHTIQRPFYESKYKAENKKK